MDLLNVAAKLFINKLGSNGNGLDVGSVVSALGGLLPTNNGELDLGSLVGQMNNGGLASLAASFLGNGSNDSFSAGSLLGLLGDSNVANFASQLGMDKDTAAGGLSSMLPDLIDQSSEGGSLLENLGSSAVSGLASKLFS